MPSAGPGFGYGARPIKSSESKAPANGDQGDQLLDSVLKEEEQRPGSAGADAETAQCASEAAGYGGTVLSRFIDFQVSEF